MSLYSQTDPQYQAALEQYEAAMKLFLQQRFDKAKILLEKIRGGPYRELADRAKAHLNVCQQRLQPQKSTPKTAEEHYEAAVVHMNQARFDEADEHLQKALRMGGKTGHYEYALATLYALRNETEPALVHLKEAISLDGRNRLLARTDDDFRLLMEDPRFTEILYPERT